MARKQVTGQFLGLDGAQWHIIAYTAGWFLAGFAVGAAVVAK